MILSVCVITYNHQQYIAQCLDSILAQKTDFEFEILIGEDDSSDGTREICKNYAERHPDRIRLFLNDRKDVIYIHGKPTGRWNLMNVLNHAQGKYVALCEGDDYWTSPDKLQKQVDFLESHPDFVICFHNSIIVYEVVDKDSHLSNLNQAEVTTIYDVIESWYIKTATMMFRHDPIRKLPDWFKETMNGDYALQLLLSNHGKIFYIDEAMSIYRKHIGGLSHIHAPILFTNSAINLMRIFNRHTEYKYDKAINKRISDLYASLTAFEKGRTLTYWRYMLQHLWYSPSKFRLLTSMILDKLK